MVPIGLIGFGEWTRQAYVPTLKELDSARVTAVAARSPASRELARSVFGDGVALYSDYRDLLAKDSARAVMIALPNQMHAGAIEAAAAAGKHLFFEPPVGLNEPEIHRVLGVLAHTGQVAQVHLELRYAPVMERISALLADGAIGKPLMARIRLWCDWGAAGRWKIVEDQSFFLWLGCWYLDPLDCLFRAAPVRATVSGGRAMNGRLMDHGWAALSYPKGQVGAFEFNMVSGEAAQITLNVAGTDGEIEADLQGGGYRWRNGKTAWQGSTAAPLQPVHGFAGVREAVADFVRAAADGHAVKSDAEVCRRVHLAALACAKAEATGRPVW